MRGRRHVLCRRGLCIGHDRKCRRSRMVREPGRLDYGAESRNGNSITRRSSRSGTGVPVSILAIDIGGTKFSMAVFEEGRMLTRESRATDREGGREWMASQLLEVASAWKKQHALDRCGIGFGGPVDFKRQRIVLS